MSNVNPGRDPRESAFEDLAPREAEAAQLHGGNTGKTKIDADSGVAGPDVDTKAPIVKTQTAVKLPNLTVSVDPSKGGKAVLSKQSKLAR